MEEVLGDPDRRREIRNFFADNAYSEDAIKNIKSDLFKYLQWTYFGADMEDKDSGFKNINKLLNEFFGDRKEYSSEDQMNFIDKIFSEEAEYSKIPQFNLATPALRRTWYGIGM